MLLVAICEGYPEKSLQKLCHLEWSIWLTYYCHDAVSAFAAGYSLIHQDQGTDNLVWSVDIGLLEAGDGETFVVLCGAIWYLKRNLDGLPGVDNLDYT